MRHFTPLVGRIWSTGRWLYGLPGAKWLNFSVSAADRKRTRILTLLNCNCCGLTGTIRTQISTNLSHHKPADIPGQNLNILKIAWNCSTNGWNNSAHCYSIRTITRNLSSLIPRINSDNLSRTSNGKTGIMNSCPNQEAWNDFKKPFHWNRFRQELCLNMLASCYRAVQTIIEYNSWNKSIW